MLKRLIILSLGLYFSQVIYAFEEKDTVAIKSTLKEVMVIGKRTNFYVEDCKVYVLDSVQLVNNYSNTLSNLLSEKLAVSITNYGSESSLNSIALRGGAARHTQVLWNGIPLNSATSGATDLSLLPVLIADQINVNYGAPASLFGSGTFGGAIELNNLADWKNIFSLNFGTHYSSFNTLGFSLKTKIGNPKVQSELNFYRKSSDGNFSFYNEYKNEISQRIHNEHLIYGGLVNFYFKPLKGLNIKSGAWYQAKDHNIPPVISSYSPGTTNQLDNSIKIYSNFDYKLSNLNLNYSFAFLNDYMLYTDLNLSNPNVYTIYSQFDTYRYINDVTGRYYWNNFKFDISAAHTHSKSDVKYYNEVVNEDELAFITAFKYKNKSFVINGSLRQQFYTNFSSKTLYSIGSRYNLLKDLLILRASFSNKYRIPTFNDRYWIDGGNPNLLPEDGWSSDASVLVKPEFGSYKFEFEVSPFYTTIKNWIQWMPGDNNIWSPVAYKEVHSKGFDITASGKTKLFSGELAVNILYSLKKSIITGSINDDVLGNILPYSPLINGNHSVKYAIKDFTFNYIMKYRGSSFSTENNEIGSIMDSFMDHSLLFAYNFKIDDVRLYTSLQCKNIFNNQNEIIKDYPLPGRTYLLNIRINL